MKKTRFDDFSGSLLVRLMVGLVFLSEGIQKLLFSESDGTGRFILLRYGAGEYSIDNRPDRHGRK